MNLCESPKGIHTPRRVPSAGHGNRYGRFVNQCPCPIQMMTQGSPVGRDPKTMLDLSSRQCGKQIEEILSALQGINPCHESGKNATSHTHTSHGRPKPAPRNHKPVPLPRKTVCIVPRKSSRLRHSSASSKRTVSSGVDELNVCSSGVSCSTLRVSRQVCGLKTKPSIKPRKCHAARHRLVSNSTQTIAPHSTGTDDITETINVKVMTQKKFFQPADEVTASARINHSQTNHSQTNHSRTSQSCSVSTHEAETHDIHSEGLLSVSHCLPSAPVNRHSGVRQEQIEIPIPRLRRVFEVSHSYDSGRDSTLNYSTDIAPPSLTGQSMLSCVYCVSVLAIFLFFNFH